MTSRIAGIFKLLIAAQFVFVAAQASAGHHEKHAAAKDIVDTAVATGQFKTLAAALEAADLVGTLKGEGPFTVFAPRCAGSPRLSAMRHAMSDERQPTLPGRSPDSTRM